MHNLKAALLVVLAILLIHGKVQTQDVSPLLVTIVDHLNSSTTAGDTVALVCSVEVATAVSASAEITWMGSGSSVIVTGGDITVSDTTMTGNVTTVSLTISPIRTSHGGEYTCAASINVSSPEPTTIANSTAYTVVVQASQPLVDIQGVNRPFIGVLFELICTAQLDEYNDLGELVAFTWFNTSINSSLANEIVTNHSSCITVSNSSLVANQMYESRIIFDPLYDSHPGDITCRAVVEASSNFVVSSDNEDTYNLEFESDLPPLLVAYNLESQDLAGGQSYEVTCLAETTGGLRSPPGIQWTAVTNDFLLQDQENGTNTSSRTILFNPFTLGHEGEYTCTACVNIDDCNGEDVFDDHCISRVVCLTTNTPGGVDLSCAGISDSALQLNWTEPAVTGCRGQEESLAVVNYEVDVENLKTGDRDDTLTLLALAVQVTGRDPGVPYNVCVTALSVAGHGTPGCKTCFSRELEPLSVAADTVIATRVNGTVLRVEWVPLTLVKARGFIQFYEVHYDATGLLNNRRKDFMSSGGGIVTVPANESTTELTWLHPRSDYRVCVAARNSAGSPPCNVNISATYPIPEDSGGGVPITAIVAGGIVATVLIIAITVAVLILLAVLVVKRHAKDMNARRNTVRHDEVATSAEPMSTPAKHPASRLHPAISLQSLGDHEPNDVG